MDHISSALALLDVLMDQKMYDEAINLFELKFMKSDKFAKSVFIPITLSLLIKVFSYFVSWYIIFNVSK